MYGMPHLDIVTKAFAATVKMSLCLYAPFLERFRYATLSNSVISMRCQDYPCTTGRFKKRNISGAWRQQRLIFPFELSLILTDCCISNSSAINWLIRISRQHCTVPRKYSLNEVDYYRKLLFISTGTFLRQYPAGLYR